MVVLGHNEYVMLLKPASSLDDLYRTLSPKPLVDPAELHAFYRSEVNSVRGGDVVSFLELGLKRAFNAFSYKAFVMGHPGVGKSTEITKLIGLIGKHYRPIRISASLELAPANFKVFDVLVLLMIRAGEALNEVQETRPFRHVPESLIRDVIAYFATETLKRSEKTTIGANVEAGAGLKGDSLWAQLLGLFANFKGEMKYAAERDKEVIEYRLNRLSVLVDLLNRFMDSTNDALFKATGQQWMFVVEDFEKFGISAAQLQEMFVNYGSVFEQLRAHLILTIPVGLVYSQQANQLPFGAEQRFMIRDTPVFQVDHKPHEEGRAALRSVLQARVQAQLFATDQMTRLVVASGGNLRDLFEMVRYAGDNAILSGPPNGIIRAEDVTTAINAKRVEYTRNLGDSPYDVEPIGYEEKMKKLQAVYRQLPGVPIPDKVLYSLLRSRAVQEFNGKNWFGVHPLVVDILKEQRLLNPDDPGGTELTG